MGRLKKLLTIYIIVCLAIISLVACDIDIVVKETSYNPSFILSGSVNEVIKYEPKFDKKIEMTRIELSEVLKSVDIIGDIKNLLIFTRSQKTILISEDCISHYYFVIASNGLCKLYSDLSLHENIGELPLVSISEIMILTNVQNGIKLIFENKSEIVDALTFLKAHGLLVKISEAEENEKFELTTFNSLTVSVAKLLGNHKSITLRFKDDSTLKVESGSEIKIYWAGGGLFISKGNKAKKESDSEKYKNPIIEIDYRESNQ